MNSNNFVVFGLLLLIAHVRSIMWYMEPNQSKCLREEIQANVLVSGEYQVSEVQGQKVDYVVRDSKGHILAQKQDIPHGKFGKFSFVTEVYDNFEICFNSHVPPNHRGVRQEITLNVKRDLEAKSFESLGEASKLKPVEVELRRLEELSKVIVEDFSRMRKSEEEMRNTNESTNARVLYFSIFSMCCLLGLATWQVFYLRRYFRAKKLIE